MKGSHMHKSLIARLVGFFASILLTATAFLIVINPDFFNLGMRMDILLILILALLQFVVQAICFLNVWGEKGPRWNLIIFASTLSIIIIIVVGAMWIMDHLNYNMMHGNF